MVERELYEETEFLHDVGVNLNAALFIIDRLIEEIKGEEGRLETDSQTENLFHHLATYLNQIDRTVKNRRTQLSELLESQRRAEQEAYRNSRSP
ncbi:hypothetical protein ACLSU7_02410 [Bdellovibrio sp. HCB185ZH]|uniref:hypothetical protein n=1 Tax=Bdellovibrio sp. HCB185ZH TaxID=3394235 RepID=UPI0039A482A1